jgi:hypothetical protein
MLLGGVRQLNLRVLKGDGAVACLWGLRNLGEFRVDSHLEYR